jgi:RHH-type rel operon transcriptional repressor/antitoxin RelB
MAISIRLDAETEKRLTELAKYTGRTKSYYVKEALAEKLEDLEDLYIAMRRAEKPEKMWTLEQIINEEDLAN